MGRFKYLHGTTSAFVVWAVVLLLSTLHGNCQANTSKISPEVLKAVQSGQFQDVIVECRESHKTLAEQGELLKDMSAVVATSDTRSAGDTRLTELVNIYQTASTFSMAPLIQLLSLVGADFSILWVANYIFIRRAWPQLIFDVAGLQIVIRIRKERLLPVDPPKPPSSPRPPPTGNSTWNIGLIDARCKDIKCLGRGVLVGVIDTGVLWNHTELKSNWIGKPYGWLDGTNETFDQLPFDHGGHGTHVTATIVGAFVGVAPEANWTACRAGDGSFSEAALIMCGQFMACPYLGNDTSPNRDTKNCSARPHIINNSWGSSGGSQTLDPSKDSYYKLLRLWNSLGIIPIFSFGNDGPSCGSGGWPGGADIVMAVGSVDNTTAISWFSSRGPATMTKPPTENTTSDYKVLFPSAPAKCLNASIQGKPVYVLTKPDIVAPGQWINSAWNESTTSYNLLQGTSMAAPHVAGVVALMICSNRARKWNHKMAYQILTKTADTRWIDLNGKKVGQTQNEWYTRSSNILCNFLGADICLRPFPNNVYGYGLVNACAAVIMAASKPRPDLIVFED